MGDSRVKATNPTFIETNFSQDGFESDSEVALDTSKATREKLTVKKALFVSFSLVAVVVAATSAVLRINNKNSFPSNFSAGEVLPNTRLSETAVNENKANGEICCSYTAKDSPHVFFWRVEMGEGSMFVQFMHESRVLSSKESLKVNSQPGYQGFNGFRIDLSGESLQISLFRTELELPQAIFINKEEEIRAEEIDHLSTLITGYVGECFAELSIKLGAEGYYARDYKIISPIHYISSNFFKLIERKSNYWDMDVLNEAISKANKLIDTSEAMPQNVRRMKRRMNSNDRFEETVIDTDAAITATASDARILMTCGTSEWWRLGDGRCDPDLNNVACNFDNGDCCRKTCKNYGYLWNFQTPGTVLLHYIY